MFYGFPDPKYLICLHSKLVLIFVALSCLSGLYGAEKTYEKEKIDAICDLSIQGACNRKLITGPLRCLEKSLNIPMPYRCPLLQEYSHLECDNQPEKFCTGNKIERMITECFSGRVPDVKWCVLPEYRRKNSTRHQFIL